MRGRYLQKFIVWNSFGFFILEFIQNYGILGSLEESYKNKKFKRISLGIQFFEKIKLPPPGFQ
jgi:hypothetical protein